jgi:shikimate kinase
METSNNSPLGDGGLIFLIGFMGSGKSYWGNIWSRQSGLPFFDLDEVIEQQQQKTIAQIFEHDGEPFFRKLEMEVLHTFTGKQNCIVACGGGTPCFNNNMEWMNANGITVYLKATPSQITNRVIGEQYKRPLIKNLTPAELHTFIEKKLEEREIFYLQARHIFPVNDVKENTINSIYNL